MYDTALIEKTKNHVFSLLQNEKSGHDWWHIYRVWKIARFIALKEKANLFTVEIAALLHDIADWKVNNGDLEAGPKAARDWLIKFNVTNAIIEEICQIIFDMSFKGAGVKSDMKTLEGKVVQDADRLDALGAIGIARAFTFGGHIGQLIHDPSIKPQFHSNFESYKQNRSTSINHFHEKLLLLKDRMNTQTAKAMAKKRSQYMEDFIQCFLQEWDEIYV